MSVQKQEESVLQTQSADLDSRFVRENNMKINTNNYVRRKCLSLKSRPDEQIITATTTATHNSRSEATSREIQDVNAHLLSWLTFWAAFP
jgi:hypothetical protein